MTPKYLILKIWKSMDTANSCYEPRRMCFVCTLSVPANVWPMIDPCTCSFRVLGQWLLCNYALCSVHKIHNTINIICNSLIIFLTLFQVCKSYVSFQKYHYLNWMSKKAMAIVYLGKPRKRSLFSGPTTKALTNPSP